MCYDILWRRGLHPEHEDAAREAGMRRAITARGRMNDDSWKGKSRMKTFWIGLAATVAAGLLTLAPSPCPGHEAGTAGGPSPVELAAPDTPRLAIERARAEGRIGFEEEILLKAYSLYAPEKLPAEYRRPGHEKCGTPIAREIEGALAALPADVAAEIVKMRARPVCDTYFETTHFRIHYDTSGDDMILGWPDPTYRDAVGVSAENSWTPVRKWFPCG